MPAMSEPHPHALRVALLEDDALLRERVLLPGLRQYGFEATGLDTAAALHAHLAAHAVELVVLDVGLPDSDGFTEARELRAAHAGLGIVMLTGRGGTPDRVRGLSEGADAYLSKPVEIELLAATLHSLARRLLGATPQPGQPWRLDEGGWCLLSPEGASVALTRGERRLVACFLQSPGRLVSRETLIAALTDDVYDFDAHRLDSMLHRLRRKVQAGCGESLPLQAVHGEGYVLTPAK